MTKGKMTVIAGCVLNSLWRIRRPILGAISVVEELAKTRTRENLMQIFKFRDYDALALYPYNKKREDGKYDCTYLIRPKYPKIISYDFSRMANCSISTEPGLLRVVEDGKLRKPSEDMKRGDWHIDICLGEDRVFVGLPNIIKSLGELHKNPGNLSVLGEEIGKWYGAGLIGRWYADQLVLDNPNLRTEDGEE